MRFEFATASRIVFGPGTSAEVATLVDQLHDGQTCQQALIVTGQRTEPARSLIESLEDQGVHCTAFPVAGEPTIETVKSGTRQAAEKRCSLVVSMGGGSAIDAGKAIAALLTNPGSPFEYLEVVGRGKPLEVSPAPFVAIPTTAGTGAEVTRNAVLSSAEHGVKVSLRSPRMLPRLAVVDPLLTHDLPPQITASTGLDALTQLIEAFVSARANPMTDAICQEGLARASRSLRRAFEQGQDPGAREDMAMASLFGGLSLANAGLGAVHGFAGPLGGMFDAPHGAVCAALLPHVMAANLRALHDRVPHGDALRRYDQLARILTGRPDATAADGLAWVGELSAALGIASLRAYGIARSDFPRLIEKASAASSMKPNPIRLTTNELANILNEAW